MTPVRKKFAHPPFCTRRDLTEASPAEERDTYVPLKYAALSRWSHFAGNLQIRRFVPAEFAAVFDPTGRICWGP